MSLFFQKSYKEVILSSPVSFHSAYSSHSQGGLFYSIEDLDPSDVELESDVSDLEGSEEELAPSQNLELTKTEEKKRTAPRIEFPSFIDAYAKQVEEELDDVGGPFEEVPKDPAKVELQEGEILKAELREKIVFDANYLSFPQKEKPYHMTLGIFSITVSGFSEKNYQEQLEKILGDLFVREGDRWRLVEEEKQNFITILKCYEGGLEGSIGLLQEEFLQEEKTYVLEEEEVLFLMPFLKALFPDDLIEIKKDLFHYLRLNQVLSMKTDQMDDWILSLKDCTHEFEELFQSICTDERKKKFLLGRKLDSFQEASLEEQLLFTHYLTEILPSLALLDEDEDLDKVLLGLQRQVILRLQGKGVTF